MLRSLEWQNDPFPHCVIDNFFPLERARKLASEFPPYEDLSWYFYNNAIEKKKTLNHWHQFPLETYRAFQDLCRERVQGTIADFGLHGGGWHIHANGGNLNPHLDYQQHPKLGLQRKFNLIVYLSEDFKPEHGGHLGLWRGDEKRPHELVKSIAPIFNRAVFFDTTQNSWHGLATPISCPEGVYRKSIAIYYLSNDVGGGREKAMFAPRPEQVGDSEIEALIQRRMKGEYK